MLLSKLLKMFFQKDSRYYTEKQFNNKVEDLADEMEGLYDNLISAGHVENELKIIDFSFSSNQESKVKSLSNLLINKGHIKSESLKDSYDINSNLYYLEGELLPQQINENSLSTFIKDLLISGYENDCELNSYGLYVG